MSQKPYNKYKDSGVEWLGEVPEHWGVKRLRFAMEMNPSKSEVSQTDLDGDVSFLPMEAVGENGSLNLEFIRKYKDVQTGYTYFTNGDVTYAKITPCFENGKGALISGLLNGFGFGTTELTVMRPLEKTFGKYLWFVTKSDSFMSTGESTMYGAGGQKRVPDDFARNFHWAFPPLPEQQAIANYLDRETAKIDTLVSEQKDLISLLKEKRQALISHTVTKGLAPNVKMKDSGVEWLGEVPEHWGVSRVKYILKILTDFTANGSFASLAENVTYLSEGYSRLVRLTDLRDNLDNDGLYISESAHNFLAKSELFGGEVLLANVGAYAGFTCIMPKIDSKSTLGPNMFMMNFDGKFASNQFIQLALSSPYAHEQLLLSSTSTAQPKLNKDDVKCVYLVIPPLPEQQAIATYLDHETAKIDDLIAEAESAISLMQERRSALISAAVTGKIDVRGDA